MQSQWTLTEEEVSPSGSPRSSSSRRDSPRPENVAVHSASNDDEHPDGLCLKAIICSVFEKERGPQILCSDPPDLDVDFESLARYLLPEDFLRGRVMNILRPSWGAQKESVLILVAPVFVADSAYERNVFQFSIALVVSCRHDRAQHRDLAQHLGVQFTVLEEQLRFVSKVAERKPPDPDEISKIQGVLTEIRKQMNSTHQCFVRIDAIHCISLLARSRPPRLPEAPHMGAVPVPLVDLSKVTVPTRSRPVSKLPYEPDPMLEDIVPLIDSVRTIQHIVDESSLDTNDVIGCMRHMLYFRLVTMIDPIRADAKYCVTADFHEVSRRPEVKREILAYVTAGRRRGGDVFDVSTLMYLYTQMDGLGEDPLRDPQTLAEFGRGHAATLSELGVSVRHFVMYGLIRGLVQRSEELCMPLTGEERAELADLRLRIGTEPDPESQDVQLMVDRMRALRQKEQERWGP